MTDPFKLTTTAELFQQLHAAQRARERSREEWRQRVRAEDKAARQQWILQKVGNA